MQDLVAIILGPVGKIDVVEADLPTDHPGFSVPAAIDDLRLGLQDDLQTLERSLPALKDRDQPAQGHRRPGQEVQITHERDQVAEAEASGNHMRAAVPQHHQESQT